MHNTVENDFFGFPKVKWLHLTGKMDKSVRFHVKIFSGFYIPNHSNRIIFDRVIQKGGSFFSGRSVYRPRTRISRSLDLWFLRCVSEKRTYAEVR